MKREKARRLLQMPLKVPRLAEMFQPFRPVSRWAKARYVAFVPPFLNRADFDGDDIPRNRPQSLGRGESSYVGQVFFTNLPSATVAGLLPAGLRIAKNLSAHPQVHPVIQLVGMQTATSWVLNGVQQGSGLDYPEFILLIPFVQKGTDRQLHNFSVRMILRDLGAISIGNGYYGYAKELGKVEIFASTAEVTVGGNDAFISQFQKTGPDVACIGAGTPLNYDEMKAILAMPILGLNTAGGWPVYVRSYFDWNDTSATVAPMTSEFNYFSAFTPGMPAQALRNVAAGAFAITGVQWTIEWPPELA